MISCRGFYRSKYVVGEEERWAGVTQFEATDARRALPSWDEPAIKAQFDVTLTVPKDRVALSNMPVIKEEGETLLSSLQRKEKKKQVLMKQEKKKKKK